MLNLPDEILFEIFLYPDIPSLQTISLVCHTVRNILISRHFCNKYALNHLCNDIKSSASNVNFVDILASSSITKAVELGFDVALKKHLKNCNLLLNDVITDQLFSKAIQNSQVSCFQMLFDLFGLIHYNEADRIIQTIFKYDQLEMFKIVYHSIKWPHKEYLLDSVKYQTDLKIFEWLFDNEFSKTLTTMKPYFYFAIRKDNEKVLKILLRKGYNIYESLYDYFDFALQNNCPKVFKFILSLDNFDFAFDWLKEDNKNLYHVLFHLYPYYIPELLPILQKKSTLNINLTDNNGKRPIEYFLQRLVQNNELAKVIQILLDDENLDFTNTKIPTSENIIPYLDSLIKKGWTPCFQNLNDSIKNDTKSLSRLLFSMLLDQFFTRNIVVTPLPLNIIRFDEFVYFFSTFLEKRHWNQYFIQNVLAWLRWGSSYPYTELTKQFISLCRAKFSEEDLFRIQCVLSMIRVNYDSILSVVDQTFVSPSMIPQIAQVLETEVRPRALLSFCKLANLKLKSFINNDTRKTRLSFFLDALILKWTGGKRKRCQTNDENFQKIWAEFNLLVKNEDTKSMAIFIKNHPEIFNKQRLSVVEFRSYKNLCDDLFELDSILTN
jgi:hypothetical protein